MHSSLESMTSEQREQDHDPPLLSGTDRETPAQPALGSPHDGYAAVLLTLALAVMFFSFGVGRRFTETADGDHWWWVPFALAAVLIPVIHFSLKYYLRAHGGHGRRGYASMPAFALFVAFSFLIMFVLHSLMEALGSHLLFAVACLTIATLIVAPMQLVLSKDPNRDSELTP